METKHQPSRQNGIVPKCQQRKEVNFFLTPIVCLSLLAFTGSSASANQWSYSGDPGFVAKSPWEVAAARASWQTPEYGAFNASYTTNTTGITYGNWGLTAIKASSAYALGYFGQGVTVGVMDSGSLLTHPEYAGGRYTPVIQQGVYGSSGYRYRPGGTATTAPDNPFTKGDSFYLTGAWRSGDADPWNDSHGTGMAGVAGANRNGTGMHGVAWASNFKIGNTGGSDSNSHGPYHDYNFMYAGYKALVDAGAQVINNSWGSYVQTADRGPGGYEATGRDGIYNGRVIPADTLKDMEYTYFYFKKAYGPYGNQWDGTGRSFLDAQYDAVKGTSVVNVWSAGNNDMRNPMYRPFYPYFNPDAEKHWIAVGGLQRTPDNADYVLNRGFDEAGPYAKWWFVVAPSNTIYTGNVSTSSATLGQPTWSAGSGTSPAAPHVTGAMAVLLSRYPNMDAIQVRDVLFTTANNKKMDGKTFLDYWTAPDGVPDERYGWGIPDLEKGMYGPGQFLGPVTYNMTKAPLDVWSNNISQVAIKAREQEERAWLADYKANGINGTKDLGADYSLGQYFDLTAIPDMPAGYDKIDPKDAEKWRKEWMDKRAAYIQNKIDNNLYTASLTKQGPGTLIMTGDNTYEGGTKVEGGNLYGFTESFGTGKVNVNGGRHAVLANYNDLFTMKGNLASNKSRLANINVNNGGTYVIMTGHDVDVDKLSFEKGSTIAVDSLDGKALRDAYFNNTVSYGTVTANTLIGYNNAALPDYAFFNVDVKKVPNYLRDNSVTLKGTISRNDDVTVASYAESNNGLKIANVIGNNRPNAIFDELVFATRSQARDTLDTLSSDMFLNADTASIVNSLSLSRMVKSQAQGAAKTGDKTRAWATGLKKSWLSLDFGQSDMDADFFAGLVGYESQVSDRNTLGLFLGAGSSNFKGGRYGSISSDDFHVGIYGIYKAPETSLTYGVMFTNQDRDMKRILRVGDQIQGNASSPHTNITQFFTEAAITKFNNDKRNFEPYVGLNVIRLKSDGYSENVGNLKFLTGSNSQTVEAATVGIRASLPLSEGKKSWALKGDVSGTWFLGDTMPEARMNLANVGYVNLKGGEIKSLLNFSLGIDANITDSAKLSLSYSGSYNRNIHSNGIVANFRYAF